MGDLALCSVWMLLLTHQIYNSWMMNLYVLLIPVFRTWISFLMYRRSRLMIVPIIMLSLMSLCFFVDPIFGYEMFCAPFVKIVTSSFALFGERLFNSADYPQYTKDADFFTNIFTFFACLWMIAYPLGVYIYRLCKKQLESGSMGVWKFVGLSAYLFACGVVPSIVMVELYIRTVSFAILALMLLLIPVIFCRGNLRNMFSRGEIALLLTFAMFFVGYICGNGLELKSIVTVCAFPAACFAIANWYFRRENRYNEVLLVVVASVVFWCAQYATGMVRLLLMFVSLAIMVVAVVRFAMDTKKYWTGAGLYLLIAIVMPIFCLGYNPYAVLEGRRGRHFDDYWYSHNGMLIVRNNCRVGIRDRYGVVLPIEYSSVWLLDISKPYCKVRKEKKWLIYDIARREFVSDEGFDHVVQCGESVYRLESERGNKYLVMPCFYDSRKDNSQAVITDEMPEE